MMTSKNEQRKYSISNFATFYSTIKLWWSLPSKPWELELSLLLSKICTTVCVCVCAKSCPGRCKIKLGKTNSLKPTKFWCWVNAFLSWFDSCERGSFSHMLLMTFFLPDNLPQVDPRKPPHHLLWLSHSLPGGLFRLTVFKDFTT